MILLLFQETTLPLIDGFQFVRQKVLHIRIISDMAIVKLGFYFWDPESPLDTEGAMLPEGYNFWLKTH